MQRQAEALEKKEEKYKEAGQGEVLQAPKMGMECSRQKEQKRHGWSVLLGVFFWGGGGEGQGRVERG